MQVHSCHTPTFVLETPNPKPSHDIDDGGACWHCINTFLASLHLAFWVLGMQDLE